MHSSSPTTRSLVGTVVLAAVLLAARPTFAQPAAPEAPASGEDAQLYSCGKGTKPFAVTLKPETELKDLLTWAMGFTCKNFIYESSILQRSKKLTVIAPNKMTPQQAYRLFLVGLSTMGLTVVPKGNVLRIVESANAKAETVPIFTRGTPANSDDVARLILRPQHIAPEELSNALAVVKSNIGIIQPVPKAGVLVITDYSSHIRDMVTMTKALDRPATGEGIYTIPVKFADAVQLVQKLSEILGTNQGGGGGKGGGDDAVMSALPSKIMADERTNTIIVLASEAGYLRVKGLVDRLDVSVEGGDSGSIHVYRLENASAEELAQTLNGALSGAQQNANRRTGTPTPTPQRGLPAQSDAGGGATFEGTVRITHDAPTNSLVVLSSGRDFQALKEVVRELDIPRRQVFIEAVILELNVGGGMDLGTSFHGGLPIGDAEDGLVFGGVQGSDLKSLDLKTLASATGLISGLIGPILPQSQELLGASIPSYAVLFQALSKSSNVNVLSSPHILATNNEEAEISVGQNIPYQGGISFGGFGVGQGGAASGLGQLSIQRQDIELSMKITPAINASNMVRLKIEQQIQDVGDKDPQLGPTWTKRKIKTTVVVRDQQSIVIGGLISDRVSYTESKVPLLGDIPILGYLFKYTKRDKRKTNLLVLLTPYVIHDQLDLQAIVERKVRERNEFLRAFQNLDRADFLPKVDYRRKRGLVEEINRTIQNVESEREILKALVEHGDGVPTGVIMYDLPGAGDDFNDADAPPVVPTPGDKPPANPAGEPVTAPGATAPRPKTPKKPAAPKPAPVQTP